MAIKTGSINYQVNLSLNQSSFQNLTKNLTQLETRVNDLNFKTKMGEDLQSIENDVKKLGNVISSSFNQKLGTVDLVNFQKALKNNNTTLADLKVSLGKVKNEGMGTWNSLTTSILSSNTQLKQTSALVQDLSTSMKNTIKWGLSSSIFNNITSSMQQAFSYAKNLDTSLNDIRIVTSKSADDMSRFAIEANKAAKALGASTIDYTDASLIYYQQGYGDRESKARADVTIKTANVTGQSGQEASEQLTAVWNGYKVNADEAELYIDKLAAVAAATAADLEELSTGMGKVASAANLMGVDIDQLNATLATVVSVTRQAPESVGTAFKTIYARMGDIEAGLDSETTLGHYTEAMKEMGFNVLDANGELRDMGAVIEEVGMKWQDMSREQQVALSQTMAGTRQYNNLLSLFDNWDMYTDALNTSANAAGTLNAQQNIYMDSLEASLQSLTTSAEEFYNVLFDENELKSFINLATNGVETLSSLFGSFGGGFGSIFGMMGSYSSFFSDTIGKGIGNSKVNQQKEDENRERVKTKSELINLRESSANDKLDFNYRVSEENYVSGKTSTKAVEIEKSLLNISSSLSEENKKQLETKRNEILATEEEIAQKEYLLSLKVKENKIVTEESGNALKQISEGTLNISDEEKYLADINTARNNTGGLLSRDTDSIEDEDYKNRQLELAQYDKDMEAYEKYMSTKKVEPGTPRQMSLLPEENYMEEPLRGDFGVSEEQREYAQQLLDKASELKDLKMNLNKEDEEILQTNIKILETSGKTLKFDALRTEDAKDLEKAIASTAKIEDNYLNKKKQNYKETKNLENDIIDLRKEANYETADLDYQLEHIKTIEKTRREMEALTGIVSVATSAWALLGASINIWSDEDASVADKLQQTLMAMVAVGPGLVSGWKNLSKSYTDFKTTVITTNAADTASTELNTLSKIKNTGAKNSNMVAGAADNAVDSAGTVIEGAETAGIELQNKALIKNTALKKLNTVEEKKSFIATMATTIATKLKAVALGIATVAQWFYNTALMANPVFAVIAALILLITIIVSVASSMETAAEKAEKKAQAAAENFQAMQESVDSLKDSLSGLEDSYDALDKLTKGTTEWQMAVMKLNSEVMALAEQYPSLMEHIKSDENGVLSFSEDGMKAVMEAQMRTLKSAQNASLNANIERDEEYLKEIEKDLKITGNFGVTRDINGDVYSDNARTTVDGETISDAFAGKEDLLRNGSNQELIDALAKTGYDVSSIDIDGFANAVRKNADEISSASGQIGQYTSSIQLYTEQLIGEAVGKLGIEDENVRNIVTENAAKDRQAAVDDEYDRLKDEYESGKSGDDPIVKAMQDDPDLFAEIMGLEDATKINEAWWGTDIDYVDANGVSQNISQDDFLERYADYNISKTEDDIAKNSYAETQGSIDKLNEESAGLGTFLAAVSEGTANQLYTEEEMKAYQKDVEAMDAGPFGLGNEDLKNLGFNEGMFGDMFGQDAAGMLADSIKNALTDEEVAQNVTDAYNAKASNTAESIDVNDTAFHEYMDQLERENELLEENDDVTIAAAKAHFELNKKMKSLGETIGEDSDLLYKLKDGVELTTDEWEKVGPMIEATQDIFGEHVDSNFVTTNLDDLMLALEGNEEAFNRLAKKSAEKVVFDNFDVTAVEDLPTEVQSMMTLINDMDMANIEIGTDLDTTSMFAALREMILATGMSAETANALLSQIGYEPEVTMEQVEYTSKKTAKNGDITYTYRDPVTDEVVTTTQSASGSIEEDGMITVPVIGTKDNPVEFKGTGAKNLGNNSPKSKGGGSSSKPKKQERREGNKDIYHDVDIALKQISNELERIQELGEEAFGEDLLKNYIDQYVLLNQELDKTAEKIRIAEGEQRRLQGELSAKGVTFNADGTMANYFAAYDTQLAQLNSVIDHYNTLSADGQEAYQDTLDQANEDFDKFVENMSEYDDTVTDLIPGLKADMEEVLNQQIELQIEAFNMEIELRLDLFAAEQDWNEFKKKIIDGIEEDDIFGNADANLKNLGSSFFNDEATGIIQTSTADLQKRIDEVNTAFKADGGVYGNHHKTALENLQEYYEELMGNLEEVYDISEEIRESYVAMMDEAQESFDKQISAYQTIRDLLQHDMDIISMIYGEESYMLLSDFYIKQEENNNKQLDFQRQQVELWRQQMDAVEEGSEEWDVAKENWLSAVSEWNSAIQDSIQNLEDKYLNTINAIFQELNNNMTNDLGLEHTGEEWDLINQNADRYLDSVNSIYETQKLADKYQQSIDEMSSVTAQKQLNDLMNEEIKALQEKDKLSQYDIDRADLRYQIALKQIALEEAQQNKSTMRLKRDTQGNYTYQYVADDDQLATLQNEMSDLYNQLYNLDADQYKANLDEIYSVWDEFQNKMFEAAQINDPELRQERELLLQEQYGEMINGIVADNEFIKENLHESTMSHLFDLYNQSTSNYDMMTQEQRDILDMFINDETNLQNMAFDNLFGLYNTNLDLFNAMTDEQNDTLMNSLVPTWDSGVQQMIDKIAGEGGFEEVTRNAFEQIAEAQKQYQEDLKELQDQAGQSFEELSNGINGTIDQSLELIDVNDELIDTYAKELDAIAGVIEGLDALEAKYEDVAKAAEKATTEAYELWREQNREAIEAAEKEAAKNLAEEAAKQEAANKPTTPPATPAPPPKPAAPSLNKGSYVTVKSGTYWHADSYGNGSTGRARNGSIKYINTKGSHPYNIDGLGWIKKSEIVGYDTGGYTGSWDKSGKLAMLHQKELVLNAQDTENMLNTVSIVRSLVGNMGSTLLERLANIGTGMANAALEKEKLEQNVQITAEFPNVKDASEIEEALNNLVNQASQEIYK